MLSWQKGPLNMQNFSIEKLRLCDRILTAFQLAVEQEDLETAEALNSAMELSMTRKTGGGEFIERRDYPIDVEKAIEGLRVLRKKAGKK